MFELEVGKEVKFKIPKNGTENIYRVMLTYDEMKEKRPIIYWVEHDGFKNGGAASDYELSKIEEYLNDGTWVRIE